MSFGPDELPDPTMEIRGREAVETGEQGQWEAVDVPSETDELVWDMGDGTRKRTSPSSPVNHTYQNTGEFTIRVQAVSGGGAIEEATASVTVTRDLTGPPGDEPGQGIDTQTLALAGAGLAFAVWWSRR